MNSFVLLMTFEEYVGISREAKEKEFKDVKEDDSYVSRTVCLASRLPLDAALKLLCKKQNEYHQKFPHMKWELRLTHVERVEDVQLSDELLDNFDVKYVEDLSYEE